VKIDAIATDYLGRVRLRLLEEPEREGFDLLLETRHYLKSSRIGGRHLRYVAEVDGDWVALLMFCRFNNYTSDWPKRLTKRNPMRIDECRLMIVDLRIELEK
jgi:hypothetical protein